MAKLILFHNVPLLVARTITRSIGATKRTLYGENLLGLDDFIAAREKVAMRVAEKRDQFMERMRGFVESDKHTMVFTEDLKNVVYISENNDEDVDLVVKMLNKFNSQNKDLRFGNFVFGPIIMRMLYHFKRSEVAVRLLKDPAMVGFFDQIVSFTVALDLLFEQQRYQDVLDIFDVCRERRINFSKFPRQCTVLALGACYKLNNSESLAYTLKILQGVKECDAFLLQKGVSFAAALALKQEDPHLALEILKMDREIHRSFINRNLKIMALAKMDQIDDVLTSIRDPLLRDVPEAFTNNSAFSTETLDAVRETIKRVQNKEKTLQFERLEESLKERGCLSNNDIDYVLCSAATPMAPRSSSRSTKQSITGFVSNFYDQRSNDNRQRTNYRQQRPKDIYE